MLQVVLAILESEETSAGPPEAVHEAATAERPGYDVSIVFGFAFTMYCFGFLLLQCTKWKE